ncbi:alpha/beta-hydrolase [Microthyrium microscopicum]|uniref:Alpha/beta-hydrolase n=1 Tax=Microthyrium microscopicum TaxID=703497 RepID=A0A6A6UB29_9PEZI|nr:alpha/beta-hydrolase [Microthyrium microscopicum]
MSENASTSTFLPQFPDEATSEGIEARRKFTCDMELTDTATLGPCPPYLRQTTIDIPLADGFKSHTILVHPSQAQTESPAPTKCPLIVYIHGGSFSYGTPAFVLSPARAFAELLGAVVACPSYKLAPEHPFPAGVHSAWESIAWLSSPENLNSGPLNNTGVQVDPTLGFVLAGTSAGANIAAVIAGIAAARRSGREDLSASLPKMGPRITGLFASIPKLLSEEIVPTKYAAAFRSRQGNANAPLITTETLRNSESRLRADVKSPWYSPVNLDLAALRDEHPAKVYVQCGELDILRDDGVIYQKILEDGGVCETKIDVLMGYDHAAWVSLPLPEAHAEEIKVKTLDGMAWLLGKSWDRSKSLPY